VELGEGGEQLFVPIGFAHGFVTLEPDTLVSYKVSAFYDPEAEGGLLWNDPALSIEWPMPAGGPILSPKDAALQPLSELDSPFAYDGSPMRLTRL
jgi:dTDP-4-dehydrorhamnose 3,5-epimerase